MRVVMLIVGLATASAQSFEVATVRIARAGPGRARGAVNGDRVTFSNTTVLNVLAQAYGLTSRDQVIGPDWVSTERYDIVAKAPDSTPKEQIPAMLKNLLIERFKMELHEETREFSVYALEVGKGRLKLKKVEGAAVKNDWVLNGEHREAKSMNMGTLAAAYLTQMLRTPVIDQTGLEGYYDFPFETTSEESRQDTAPSVFDVIDNLGLKLEAKKVPLEVVVVESGDKKPIEN